MAPASFLELVIPFGGKRKKICIVSRREIVTRFIASPLRHLRRTHTDAAGMETTPPLSTLPEIGFVRLRDVLKVIPISKTVWYEGVDAGRFPKPVKIGRCSLYPVEKIRALIEVLSPKEPPNGETGVASSPPHGV